MFAILNQYDDPQLYELQLVRIGEHVISNISDFDITKGKEYKIIEVHSPVDIAIENDKGIIDMYTVEYFDLKRENDNEQE